MVNEFKLIRSGLPSEYFLLSFIKSDIPYQIAKIIKNTDKTPDVSKIYPAKDRLVDEGYLVKQGSKFIPNFKKLAEGVSMLLIEKEKTISDIELQLIEHFLKNSKFFESSPDLIQKIKEQQKGEHDIDALQIIAGRIGAMAMGGLMMRKFDNTFSEKMESNKITSLEEFKKVSEGMADFWNDEIMPKIEEQMEKELPVSEFTNIDPVIQKRLLEFMMLMFKSMSFSMLYMAPEDFLKKISTLSDGTDMVEIVDQFSKFQKKSEC